MPPEEGGGAVIRSKPWYLPRDGDSFFDLVGGEVFGGDEASAGLFEVGDLVGHRAFVEVVGVGGDAGPGWRPVPVA